ncbi:nucleoside diphosphate phosphatase ENTPD5 [Rhinophrynus dorsalis]
MRCWISLMISHDAFYIFLTSCLVGFCLSDIHSTSNLNFTNNAVYGIMFDAGSTGTRIHIYIFQKRAKGAPLALDGEVFESVKPGLSAFADQPKKGADTVRLLLDLAQNKVPSTHWARTPVALRATAGLRLLPEHKAEALLSEIRHVFHESPFLVPEDSVSIMNGTDEGILAWIAVNFLTGRLQGHHTVGILDLGGGSTQITFLPLSKTTLDQTPRDFLAYFELFNSTYRVYTHSYLGLGLKAARLAVLGVSEPAVQQGIVFRSHCLPMGLVGEWSLDGITFNYGGRSEGQTGFNACYSEVLQILRGRLHQTDEIRSGSFYAFSYYYDRAVDTSLIDPRHGGKLQVKDFARKAMEVCDNMDQFSSHTPFLCMDLTYITALLLEGFGFDDKTTLQLTKKMHNVEMSWTLGAMFHVLQSLEH